MNTNRYIEFRGTPEQMADLKKAQERLKVAADKAAVSLAKFDSPTKPISESFFVAMSPWGRSARYALQLEAEQHERDRRREMGL